MKKIIYENEMYKESPIAYSQYVLYDEKNNMPYQVQSILGNNQMEEERAMLIIKNNGGMNYKIRVHEFDYYGNLIRTIEFSQKKNTK